MRLACLLQEGLLSGYPFNQSEQRFPSLIERLISKVANVTVPAQLICCTKLRHAPKGRRRSPRKAPLCRDLIQVSLTLARLEVL